MDEILRIATKFGLMPMEAALMEVIEGQFRSRSLPTNNEDIFWRQHDHLGLEGGRRQCK